MQAILEEKYKKLVSYLEALGSVLVAYSGGVDSTLLAKIAYDTLGESMMAVTIRSAVLSQREQNDVTSFCSLQSIPHIWMDQDVFSISGFQENPENRCYLCKKAIFSQLKDYAKQHGFSYVCEGSNVDDKKDYRPGMKAIQELEIKSPLEYAGFTKAEIRTLSKELNLPTYDKPSFACLASRFVYGERITEAKLEKVDRAEQLLYELGFTQFRVRMHGDTIARIELLPEEFSKLLSEDLRTQIVSYYQEIGFSYITLDLLGYRMGSMNETLSQEEMDKGKG